MFTKRFSFTLVLAFFTLLAACAAPEDAAVDGADPVAIVQMYYAALDAQDIELAMSYIAPTAEFANPTGKYTTTAEIRASLEGLFKDGITFELSNFRTTDGGRVVYDYKVLLGDELLDSGTDGLTIVKDGLIIFDGTERTEG